MASTDQGNKPAQRPDIIFHKMNADSGKKYLHKLHLCFRQNYIFLLPEIT